MRLSLRIAALACLCLCLTGQTTQPIQYGIVGVSSTATVIDNRSEAYRRFDYHGFCALGTGTWSASLQYSDTASTGPWTTFTSTPATITNSSTRCNGFGLGYHPYLRFLITGDVVVSYTGVKTFNFPIVDASGDYTASAVLDIAAVADGTCYLDTTAVTVAGAALGGRATIGYSYQPPEGVTILPKVTGPNSVKVEVCNISGASYNPPSATYYLGVSQ